MKKIILIALALSACAQDEQEQITKTTGTGCSATIETNIHSNGSKVEALMIFPGCREDVVFRFETRNADGSILSSFRSGINCDTTSKDISFASKGVKIYGGLFPCGSSQGVSGRAYTLQLIQGKDTVTVKGRIGYTIEYTVK